MRIDPHSDPLPEYRAREKILLAIPLAIYFCLAIPATIHWLERLNSDGVCYLHRAMLLAGGDVRDAISAYWSPGLILSTVPVLKLGIDPLHAIHWVLFAFGALFVIGAQWFFNSLHYRTIASSIVALLALRMIGPVITPDVLLGAAMMFYLAALLRKKWLLAGLIAGVGFWCKAYFLPFFLVQFPLVLLMQRGAWRALASGLLGLLVIAGPWIGVLSAHEGRFTFSSATTRNRFMQNIAPPDLRAPDVSSLPPDPFISNLEVTDRDAWPSWSPLDSWSHCEHQLRVICDHLRTLMTDVWKFDYVGIVLLAVIAGAILGDANVRSLVISGVIYAAGFMLVAYETRYVLPVLLPIGIALVLMMSRRIAWRPLPVIVLLPLLIAGAYADFSHLTEKSPSPTYREIAEKLKSQGLDGRFVTNTNNRDRAACTAFFLNQKFIAMPPDNDSASLESKLRERGITLVFRWFDPHYNESIDWPEAQTRLLLADGLWKKQISLHLDSIRRLDVYIRR